MTWQGMAMHGDGVGRRKGKEGESEAHRQTDTQTDRGVAGEEGGRKGDLLAIAWERIRRGDSHTTQHDTIHRNNGRHRTRRGNGDAWRWRRERSWWVTGEEGEAYILFAWGARR
jgi:hypothetical protein